MKIATDCTLPADIIAEARELWSGKGPMGSEIRVAGLGAATFWQGEYSAEWVACDFALPHHDRHLTTTDYFVLLPVMSHHFIGVGNRGQRSTGGAQCDLRPGDIFLLDPASLHWAFPSEMDPDERPRRSYTMSPLACVSWTVPKRRGKAFARRLARDLDGRLVA